jgi:phosphatidate cytidylyltransferase
LAVLAIGATLLGGALFVLFWTLAAIAVAAEWIGLFGGGRKAVAFAALVLVSASLAVALGEGLIALLVLAAGTALLALMSSPVQAAGILYAAPVALGATVLRADPVLGLAAILWLFAVVWGTDIGAYAVGRTVGGPRFWPAVSPKKTWSGMLGGLFFGVAAATALAAAFGLTDIAMLVLVGLAVSIVTHAGDLAESALKRRVGVKDSGHIIPGHGGVMDRLDGFTAAVALAACLGVLRGGAQAAGQGLLQW